MSGEPVEELREQLRERGYLTHGIERWFALDPWRSTTFWRELLVVSAKAGAILAVLAAVPVTTITAMRNQPVGTPEIAVLAALYAAAAFLFASAFVAVTGLLLKLRPAVVIDTPRVLLTLSIASAGALTLPLALWWWRFDSAAGRAELLAGSSLLTAFFVAAALVVSAALLTFSVFELHRIPAIHQKPRTAPLAAAAAVVVAALFVHAGAHDRPLQAAAPAQVATAPVARRVAFLAVDGLTSDLFRSHAGLAPAFTIVAPVPQLEAESTTERWATAGTGVPRVLHGVRSVEGVRLAGSANVLQSVSRLDLVLRRLAPAVRLAERAPLPPTVRRRSYVWEIAGARGVSSAAVNWWTSATGRTGALDAVGPDEIFAFAAGSATALDMHASARLLAMIDRQSPRFATAYLPALDVVLNRQELDASSRLARSVEALDGTAALVKALRRRGYDLVLLGLPGDGQSGKGVLASTIPLAPPRSALDAAPTMLALVGFPPSREMAGADLTRSAPRIDTYGERETQALPRATDREYYENLKSLGYVR